MRALRLIALIVFAGALVLLYGPQVVAADGQRTFTPEQIELIAMKEQARRLDSRAAATAPVTVPFPAGPDAPVIRSTETVMISKAAMREAFNIRRASVEAFIHELVRAGNLAAANRVRLDLAAEAARVEAAPEGESAIDVPAIETGAHSIKLSMYAYDSSYNIKDPMSFVFFNRGSSWDVWYDLQNWTQPLWSNETTCASGLQAYTWDAQHGGTDGWEFQDYHLKYQASWCLGGRYHLRLFDRGFTDTHGQYGRWSFSEPHYDREGDHCVSDWDGAQEVLRQSFYDDQTGQLLWFVGQIYQVNWGNGGYYGCANADGLGWYVNLTN